MSDAGLGGRCLAGGGVCEGCPPQRQRHAPFTPPLTPHVMACASDVQPGNGRLSDSPKRRPGRLRRVLLSAAMRAPAGRWPAAMCGIHLARLLSRSEVVAEDLNPFRCLSCLAFHPSEGVPVSRCTTDRSQLASIPSPVSSRRASVAASLVGLSTPWTDRLSYRIVADTFRAKRKGECTAVVEDRRVHRRHHRPTSQPQRAKLSRGCTRLDPVADSRYRCLLHTSCPRNLTRAWCVPGIVGHNGMPSMRKEDNIP